VIGFIVFTLLWGLAVGGLARLAIPGPDPMPLWATLALGLGGSIIGGIASHLLFGLGAGLAGSVIFSMLLLAWYRSQVQKRPLWGPGARQLPR
jgi:uncharacterized membrane protein YeaQ/YmgE (transglycosylase-associated protein family)